MKAITKLIYTAFAVVLFAIGAVTTQGAAGDLFASINGLPPHNSGGFIYQYRPNGMQLTFASGLSRPRGVAFNHRSGNLFMATNTCSDVTGKCRVSIVKITSDGMQSTVGTLNGDLFAEGVAYDRASNFFVLASDNTDPNFAATIYKFTPNGVQSTFGSLPMFAFGLAFDSAGNLFAASGDEASVPTIYKFTPDGTRTVFVHPSLTPADLAFDRFGNLFGSTEGAAPNDMILKFTPDGVESTFATGLNNPRGLAFDSGGNLFVAEFPADISGDILKFTPDGSRTVFTVVPGGGNSGPEFLAFQH